MNGFHLPEDRLPRFLPLPEKLLTADLTLAELRVYLLLLRRSFLSARSPRWVDGDGRVYLYYPIKELARTLERGDTCIKKVLKTLEEKDLILRVRQGAGKPNRIYVKFPAEEEPYDPVTDAPCDPGTDTPCDPAAVTPCDPGRGGKVTPSNIERRERKERYEGKEKGEPSPAEAQSAVFREDGPDGCHPGAGPQTGFCDPPHVRTSFHLPSGTGERIATAPLGLRNDGDSKPHGRLLEGRERRRFRRRENCSFPLKPAVDWFKMVLSKNGRENL